MLTYLFTKSHCPLYTVSDDITISFTFLQLLETIKMACYLDRWILKTGKTVLKSYNSEYTIAAYLDWLVNVITFISTQSSNNWFVIIAIGWHQFETRCKYLEIVHVWSIIPFNIGFLTVCIWVIEKIRKKIDNQWRMVSCVVQNLFDT